MSKNARREIDIPDVPPLAVLVPHPLTSLLRHHPLLVITDVHTCALMLRETSTRKASTHRKVD